MLLYSPTKSTPFHADSKSAYFLIKELKYLKSKFEKESERNNWLSIEQLSKLTTKRLLAYYKKHRRVRWFGMCSCCGEKNPINKEEKLFFEDLEQYANNIQKLLNTREHVVR